MSAIKLIAIDLDDTLLHDDISVSDYTKKVLKSAMDKGVKICHCDRPHVPGCASVGTGDRSWRCADDLLYGLHDGALRKREGAP